MSEATPTPQTEENAGFVVVQGGTTAYAQQIQAGEHCLSADEPVALGGGDTGPTPYQLLLGALGSCTSITLSMYARRKGWPLENVTVRLRHSRARPAGGGEAVETIERHIELSGPLSDQQRERLLAIASRCPVHRTLLSPVEITTEGA